MSAPAGTRHRGYDHAAFYYSSHEELLSVATPFLLDGVNAGEPTVVSLARDKADLLRAVLPDSPHLAFLGTDGLYARPATAIRTYRELMAEFVAGGARQIRIVGEVPPSGLHDTWDWWARYESAVNHAYDDFPLRSMCGYDTRVTPRHVLDDVARTHPFVVSAEGWLPARERYVDPPVFLTAARPVADHPIQRTPALVDLVDPSPVAARRAVTEADRSGLPGTEIGNLVLSVSEVVTNALRHGRGPVRFRVWSAPGQLVATVHDRGTGPADPFAGLLPASNSPSGGFGLWLAHQLCSHVTLDRGADGFTVRLTAGDPRRS
ncbi:sensor histidine kinase [Umezawaea beigongshangensis]|uniref:sensor histidine kinase n=1 Tax=Umezawaea beigongshangensis TaxID=2780383 RepID=UPI0018F15C57|nr:sensor histidine kinase [Umezawaea beigongshangensis]